MFHENMFRQGNEQLPNSLDGSEVFPDIESDSQLMVMMQEPGFWEKYNANPEMQRKITAYIGQDEKKPSAGIDFSQMGMSAYRDVTNDTQETPLQGLMGMAAYNNAPKRGLMG